VNTEQDKLGNKALTTAPDTKQTQNSKTIENKTNLETVSIAERLQKQQHAQNP